MKFRQACARVCTQFVFFAGIVVPIFLSNLRAGDYSVTTWGVDEGLPQSSVTDIAQTPDGYLWIGTLLSGLSRFDGVQFVNFDSANSPGLVNPGVRRLLVDSQGNLWVNDYGGNLLLRQGNSFVNVAEDLRLGTLLGERRGRLALATIDGDLVVGRLAAAGKWNWQRFKPPFAGGAIYGCEDSDGVLWFQAPSGKIARFKDDKFEVLDSLPGLSGKKILALSSDHQGNIFVGTEVELARWENGSFINLSPGGPAKKISVRRLTPLPDGALWVEADGKFFLYETNHWSPPVGEWDGNLIPWSHFRTLRTEAGGGLWISLGDEGLVHIGRDRKLSRVTSAEGLPSQLVQAFYCGRDGSLWAGYHRGGLVQLRQETFHSVARREGLLDTLVTSVTEDSSGAIWLGTAGGSVARWADGICQNFSLPLRGSFCQDVVVCAGKNGRVWVGTGGNGLLFFEQGEFRHAVLPEKIPQSVRQLLVAKNGDVWFANISGLYRFDGVNLEKIYTPKGNDQVVASLAQTPDGSIWFGTFSGELQRWQDGQFTSFRPEDKIGASRFWALCAEGDGTLWVGTLNGGLLRFQAGRFNRYTTADGLADNSISHILADDCGHLWLGSRAGVICLTKSSLQAHAGKANAVECRVFGRSDGLPTLAMTLEFQPSCVRAMNGDLWFGSPKGASSVNPAEVRPVDAALSVLIESVMTDNAARDLATQKVDSLLPNLRIEPEVKNIEVRFSAPAFTAPELMKFKYRLEPLDSDWTDLGVRRSVSFPRLPAGQYVFHVIAENGDHVRSSMSAGLRLEVEPHFWERKSFLAAVVSVLLLVVGIIVRRTTQQRLRRKLESLRQQQQIERERARIAQDLHDDLGAGLTEISLTSDLASNPLMPEYESRQYTHEIGSRARELVQRMDEIVWAVNPRNDSINSLSVYACQYAQQLLKPLDIACRLDVQPGLPEIPLNAEQRYNFFLAYKESVTNVARHSQAREFHLAISAEKGHLQFIIEDDGRGFAPGNALAGADGLRNIRERIERVGGQCEIDSQTGKGTRVSLRVPVNFTEAHGSS